jgi:uncharacterized protein (DUF2126 family)
MSIGREEFRAHQNKRTSAFKRIYEYQIIETCRDKRCTVSSQVRALRKEFAPVGVVARERMGKWYI